VAKEPRRLKVESVDLLTAVCNQIGIAIGNANLVSELKQKTADLEKANQVKNEFLGVISHELRSPLQVIIGYMNLVSQDAFGELPPGLKDVLTRVEEQTGKLMSLVEQILVTTNIVTGMVRISIGRFDLARMVQEVRSHYPTPPSRDLQMIWDGDP
jgi:K+-sensing histidine kinase KdpD